MNKQVMPVSSLSLKLPTANRAIETYRLAASRMFPAKLQGTLNRVAFSAAHVVCDPLADIDPWLSAAVDWDRTIAFREHVWDLGLGVAEAMDTAQRGMGLDWPTSLELIGTFTTATIPAFAATEVAAPATASPAGTPATYTFTALAAGTADSTRILVALIDGWNGGAAISSAVTIGGVSATKAAGCDAFTQSVWYAAVPTGTTADVVVAHPGGIINVTVKLWRVVGSQAAPTQAINTAFNFTSPSTSIAVTVPAGGASIVQMWADATGRTVGWTGATGASLNNTTLRSIASASATATGTVTAAWSGGNGNFLASAVSFGP